MHGCGSVFDEALEVDIGIRNLVFISIDSYKVKQVVNESQQMVSALDDDPHIFVLLLVHLAGKSILKKR